MNLLDKIRKKPEKTRKIIFWIIVIIFGLILLVVWITISYKEIANFPKNEFINGLNLPSFNK